MTAINGVKTTVAIGPLSVWRSPEISLTSCRHSPLSTAMVVLPDPYGELSGKVAIGDPVEISIGYRDKPSSAWTGSVTAITSVKEQIICKAVGGDKSLATTIVTQSFVDEDASAIVSYAVAMSGLPVGRIDSVGGVIPRFSAGSIPVWQVARQCAVTCHRAFGVDMSAWALWLGRDGVNWGDFDEPGEVPVVATRSGLIRHLPVSPGLGMLSRVETFLLPGLSHSQLFELDDKKRKIKGTFRALSVRHTIKECRARTIIDFGEEYGRC